TPRRVHTGPRVADAFEERQLEEKRTVTANRRWAMAASIAPGIVAGIVAGIVVALTGPPLAGLGVTVVVTAALACWVWFAAPGIVIRGLGATPSSNEEHPRLHNVVDGVCATMGLPRPTVLVVESPVPNAMTIGRDPQNASLIVTAGLESALDLVELEGVITHELVHIKRCDMVRSGIAVAMVVPLSLLSSTGPEIVHSLVGRGREFSADQRAIEVVRYPAGLGSALRCMVESTDVSPSWPPGRGRISVLTRWLWIDPMVGTKRGEPKVGDLDDTGMRAAALALL
ncbi:MAG: M48 family metalloprotease, partial [Acidimicrobiales bacterium]